MGRVSVIPVARHLVTEEPHLLDPTAPAGPGQDPGAARATRRSTSIPIPSWRDRIRARAGTEELLTFHVGTERFATALAAIEEAVEHPELHRVPEMPDTMLGVFSLRGRLVPLCSPVRALGIEVTVAEPTVLLLRSGTRRLGVAVDDVDDVVTLDLATVRPAPGIDDSDGVLLGVVRQGNALLAIVDPEAIVAACLTSQVLEAL
jgi:chemotaxis signal transduction protein